MQEEFAHLLYQLKEVAQKDECQALLLLEPMHQVHNNENEYCWQIKGKANTARRRLNVIGAVHATNIESTVILTEENLQKKLLIEIKVQYKYAPDICIVLDNVKYQRYYSL